MKGRLTTRSYFDDESATGHLPETDYAIQRIIDCIHGDEFFSGETVITWRDGSLRLPWDKIWVNVPDARRAGKRELKQMIETPFREFLPNPTFSGKMHFRTNKGERSGKLKFIEDSK